MGFSRHGQARAAVKPGTRAKKGLTQASESPSETCLSLFLRDGTSGATSKVEFEKVGTCFFKRLKCARSKRPSLVIKRPSLVIKYTSLEIRYASLEAEYASPETKSASPEAK